MALAVMPGPGWSMLYSIAFSFSSSALDILMTIRKGGLPCGPCKEPCQAPTTFCANNAPPEPAVNAISQSTSFFMGDSSQAIVSWHSVHVGDESRTRLSPDSHERVLRSE